MSQNYKEKQKDDTIQKRAYLWGDKESNWTEGKYMGYFKIC